MQTELLPSPPSPTDDTRLTLMERSSIGASSRARYNNAVIRLAPHQLFERGGDLFVSAFNLDKAWRSQDEQRLGQFKLVGLSEVQQLGDTFCFDGSLPRPSDVLVLAV